MDILFAKWQIFDRGSKKQSKRQKVNSSDIFTFAFLSITFGSWKS
ncbi:hypothetical protein [Aerosakkonema sp. BLCC-F183]